MLGNNMDQQGWIQLYRKFMDWEWYTDTNTKSLFIHCLLKANHKEGKWRGHKIARGQFLTSLNNLSQETGLSVRNVRTSLKHLENTGEVTRKATQQLTKLTVCNYDTYNNLSLSSDTLSDNQVTNDRHTGDTRVTTNNNNNNNNNENNNQKSSAIDPNETTKPKPDAFSKFFEVYPKRFNPMCHYTKSAFFEAVSKADGEDPILVNASMYANYFEKTNEPIKYAMKAKEWLETESWRTDWNEELKKHKSKNAKFLSTSGCSDIKPGDVF